jgi:murein DD-endopeptidase MepM/ murein hydrolase activator NlpD
MPGVPVVEEADVTDPDEHFVCQLEVDLSVDEPDGESEPFDITLGAAIDRARFTRGYGGPNQGGHRGPTWYIQYGMDLGGRAGAAVYAAFDGHITRYRPHDPATDTPKVFGAQMFIRSDNDKAGAFYTHMTNVSAALGPGSRLRRGDRLGTVMEYAPTAAHLHLALVEIIGGAPGGRYQGVDLYRLFLDLQTPTAPAAVTVRFMQNGTPPVVLAAGVLAGSAQ